MRKLALGLLAVVATGALLTLALPLGEQAWMAWFALAPLLLAVRGRGFLLGFVAGLAAAFFAAWLGAEGWLYAHRSPGDTTWIYGSYAKYAFSFGLAFAVWGEPASRRLPAWWFAALATLLEAALLFMIPAHLALSQYRHAFWVQLASVGGVWLVSFAVWWTNFALAEWVADRKWNRGLLVPLLALLLGLAWLPSGGKARTFAAVQIAEPDEEGLLRYQREATSARASLVVWPEFAGLAFVRQGDVSGLRAVGGAPFVTSFPDAYRPKPHNTAALFASGREVGRYDKRKLFGGEVNMHTPGEKAVAVDGVGLNVCFDSCFPAVIRDTTLQGARVVALPTTDPPSANDFVAAMHAAYTPFRAAESGVAMVRADGAAFSMIVDSRGRIVGERESGDGVLVARASAHRRITPYRLMGDAALWVCGGLVLLGFGKLRSKDRVPRVLRFEDRAAVTRDGSP